MDEANGPLFGQHDELFAPITSADAEQQLKDFVFEMTGSMSSGPSGVGSQWGQAPHRPPESNSFPVSLDHSLMNSALPQRGYFHDGGSFDMHADASAFLDNLVKSFPDDLMDGVNGMDAIKRNLMALPEKSQQPAGIMETMHRLSTDNGTQEYLDSLSKPDVHENKISDHQTWNGAAVDPYAFHPSPVHKTEINLPSLRGISRNGGCPTNYTNGLLDPAKPHRSLHNHDVTKSRHLFNPGIKPGLQIDVMDILNRELQPSKVPATELAQSVLIKGLSPSISADSAIHTPTTGSYESASPLSSGRTPLRSDDSISPLTSCASPAASVRTPMRTDDCFSPGRVRRTPIRNDETPSPRAVSRTPLRCDDIPSPAMRHSVRSDDVPSPANRTVQDGRMPASPAAPSPRGIGWTPLRPDDAPSPRPVSRTRTDDALSPRGLARGSLRAEDATSPKACTWTPLRVEDTGSPRMAGRTPLRYEEIPSPWSQGRTPLRSDEALSPRGTSRLRPDDIPSPRAKAAFRPDDGSRVPDPMHYEVSQLPPRAPFSPSTVRRREVEVGGNHLLAGPAPALPGPSAFPNLVKPRKRRKTDSTSVPAPKKKCTNKMPIYQSTMSEADSGIKLKLKLTAMPPPKRRRRKPDADDVDKKSKKKRIPDSPEEQSVWGRDLPPHVLERIFKMVVSEEGCVPSLVRFSSVCRLWNFVAAKTELWQNVDLSSPCIKQKCKIDRYFRWLLENRLGPIRDLNLNGWKFSNLAMVLSCIGAHCKEIESIGMSGWQGLHFEHLRSLLQDCPRLARIDLSDVSPESKGTNSATSPKSITYLTETMADRLTELSLAHNTLSCLPQIISSLAANCPNLQVLDLSNIRRASHAEFALHVEELQMGCPLLRVLRITNSCITIAVVPFDQQAASPGFPALEELSIAGHQGTESLRITSVMDDDCLERIVKTSHKLRLLDVRGCTRITESSLVRVPAWDIQHLFLSGCLVTRQASSGLELIAQKWSHSLLEVDLAWSSVAEDLNAAVMALAERGADSPLRILNLCGSAVGTAPVKTLLTRCPQLESLNLQSCRGLPRGVKRLYERHQLPELLEMLQQCEDTQDDG